MLDKTELWIHDHILKNDFVRHTMYGLYQRIFCAISPKIKAESTIRRLSPDNESEYLFGYYDKCPWDEDGNRILALKVSDAHRRADSNQPADVVVIDAQSNTEQLIAQTHCWNVQQGCMAQWYDANTVLFNDFRDGQYCAVIRRIDHEQERVIPMPVYTVSADRRAALTLDFSRLHRLRPGYGYCNLEETTKDEKCPNTPCIWRINLLDGSIVPILKYTDLARFEPRAGAEDAEHKVNHLMISPRAKRFMVLHRWFKDGKKYTRLVTADMDGGNLYNLSDDDFASHCCWKNDEEILSYLNKKESGKGYYLLRDRTDQYMKCWQELVMDGHPSYSPDRRSVITDTYPDRKRVQSIYLMRGPNVRCLTRVFSPFRYPGNVRCDLHPRWSRDGKQICFDAAFEGKRQIYCIDCVPPYALSGYTIQPASSAYARRYNGIW